MLHHARRLQKILLKPIFKNINSLFPRAKYRGMFVFVFSVANTLRNVFIIYKMESFILEDNIEVCLLLIPTISGNLPQHNTIRPSLRKRKKQKDINISQRIIQFTYMCKRYGITWKNQDWTQAVRTPTRHFWQYIHDSLRILTPSISKVLYPIEEKTNLFLGATDSRLGKRKGGSKELCANVLGLHG